jgi:spore germination cell wall hydrolase CwlJ-like protein
MLVSPLDPERYNHGDGAVGTALASSRGKIKDPTGGALHCYAHDKVKPYWSSRGYRLIVGEHTFVRLMGR